MKRNTVLIMLFYFLSIYSKAQFCDNVPGACYKENACFQTSEINTHDYVFSTVKNTYNSASTPVDLYMTIYSACALPDNINTKVASAGCLQCKRPFILLIHGGGFRYGCRTIISNDCMEFAKRGYVVASIDYRLGWVPEDTKKHCKNFCYTGSCSFLVTQPCRAAYKDSLDFAVYRSIQDASAGMRFIAHYADNLNVDTNYLYIGGYSAGAIAAASICYMSQNDLNVSIPKAYSRLGPFDSYGNAFKNKYKIAGFFNNWGGIDDTAYIQGINDKIPMIAFHGLDDSIVPIGKGLPFNCRNGAYGYSYGSRAMYSTLVNKYPDMPVELYACYGNHGIFAGNPQTDQKSLYRIQKAVCFFNRVRNGDKSRNFIQINKDEKYITYSELDSISPVNCEFNAMHSAQFANTSK
jgi:hypothetical protein